MDGPVVYLAWTTVTVDTTDLAGPWREVRAAAEGLLLVESDESLSRVYHELKWALGDDGPLLVVPLTERPKLRGLAPGTQTWLRDRLPPPGDT